MCMSSCACELPLCIIVHMYNVFAELLSPCFFAFPIAIALIPSAPPLQVTPQAISTPPPEKAKKVAPPPPPKPKPRKAS